MCTRHGAGVTDVCYITVGTGVGVGVCVNGSTVTGNMHPEAGHILTPLSEQDVASGFRGSCPFHGSCVEGMSNSASIAARTGLERADLETLSDEDAVWPAVAHYIGHLCLSLSYIASPQVIVVGGGVFERTALLPLIRSR
jgi:fructokinase